MVHAKKTRELKGTEVLLSGLQQNTCEKTP